MNRTKIDWPCLDYTWNPVVGCKRNCSYCYARAINDRFKIIPEWTNPYFFEGRLNQPEKVKKSSVIFVGSMSDICYWDGEWKDRIINVCNVNSQHEFMFLTKNPQKAYGGWYFPDNCTLGCTITTNKDVRKIGDLCYAADENRIFISIEPLIEDVSKCISLINMFDNNVLIIVGAMTGRNAIKPDLRWLDDLEHPNVHYKENIRKYMREEQGLITEELPF